MKYNDQQFAAQRIREQYVEKQEGALTALRALDRKVKRPANVFAYVFGSVSAIIMGTGMSLVMTEIGQVLGLDHAMLPGVIIGVVGLVLAAVNFPIYKKWLAARKKRYSAEILELSNKIIEE